MTNQEAINVLFNEWKCIDRNDGIHCDRKCESCDLVMDVQIIREAFNKAISALEAQEAKAQLSREDTTFDLISRQAAIDVLGVFTQADALGHTPKQIVEALPSAQPERKKGKWIEQDDAWDGVYYECSVCKEAFTLIDGTPSDNLYNFCPNCGADMREDENVHP